MTGPFIAHETVLRCKTCGKIFFSDSLKKLVKRFGNVGYDVLVFVGKALFQRFRTTGEVRAELAVRGVLISASEIVHLGRSFITYLAKAHRLSAPRIRKAMEQKGGYILHLDATHEGDAPALMTGMDSLSDMVLANIKIPTEQTEHIVPFLTEIKKAYGQPVACVHDMGTGICKAITEVFPGVHDFICHFHFLRDIGKDYLDPSYRELRKILRRHAITSRLRSLARKAKDFLDKQKVDTGSLANAIKIGSFKGNPSLISHASTYSLILWCLNGKKSGDGYGFPFDRPLLEFAERLIILHQRLKNLLHLIPISKQSDYKILVKLAKDLQAIAYDSQLHKEVENLKWRAQIFDRLRSAMRIAEPSGNNALNDDGSTESMDTIKKGVISFRLQLDENPKLSNDSLSRNMAKQIDKYTDKLFADPIEKITPNGVITIYPQRTNNILEQFFRSVRRAHRRKSGNNSMNRVLQTMLADTPLIKNLDNPGYMEILLDGKENLEALFAELDSIEDEASNTPQNDNERMLPGFKSIINLPNLPDMIVQMISHAE